MSSLHDNIILSYEVDLENDRIRRFTRSSHDVPKNMDVLFSGWPVNYDSYHELQTQLMEEKYKYMVISSSYELNGWVLAKSVDISVQETG
jgi:hypothetical protein